jgi:hypothetical protein
LDGEPIVSHDYEWLNYFLIIRGGLTTGVRQFAQMRFSH